MTRDLKRKDNPIQSGKPPLDKWIRLLLHSARRQQQDQVTERKYDLDPVGRCSQHVSKIRSRTAELITRTIPSKQVRVGLPAKQRNSNVESGWISTPSLCKPTSSTAAWLACSGAGRTSISRGRRDGCLRFRSESVELPGSNGRRFGPEAVELPGSNSSC